jgi:hypothetical protein
MPTLFLTKVSKTYNGEKSLFNKCYWEKWLFAFRKLKLDTCLSPCTNINSNWIKDLNIRSEILQLVQERSGNTLEIIGTGNNFLSGSSSPVMRRKCGKMGLHEIKKLVHNKRNGL